MGIVYVHQNVWPKRTIAAKAEQVIHAITPLTSPFFIIGREVKKTHGIPIVNSSHQLYGVVYYSPGGQKTTY